MKGQSSSEYILLFLVSLIIFIPILIQSTNVFVQKRADVALQQSQSAVNSMTDAVNFLCLQPKESKLTILVYFPNEINFDNSRILAKTIQIVVSNQNFNETVYANTKCTINGTLPRSGGQYSMEIKNTGDNVTIAPKSG